MWPQKLPLLQGGGYHLPALRFSQKHQLAAIHPTKARRHEPTRMAESFNPRPRDPRDPTLRSTRPRKSLPSIRISKRLCSSWQKFQWSGREATQTRPVYNQKNWRLLQPEHSRFQWYPTRFSRVLREWTTNRWTFTLWPKNYLFPWELFRFVF